jgi:dTDP-4-amino-4,6-dideoxygalactose transaminase
MQTLFIQTHDSTDCPIATDLSKRVLSLPVHQQLTEQDLNLIIESFKTLEEKQWTLA